MKLSHAVALRLQELLKQNNMTRYALFKATGVTQPTIGDVLFERNKSVSLLILYELCQGFGINLREFFDSPLFDTENIED